MLALDDVKFTQQGHAVRPNAGSRIMRVHKRFDRWFETPPPPETAVAPDASATSTAPADGTATASTTGPAAGATSRNAAAPPPAAPEGAQKDIADNNAEAKPVEQGVEIEAEQVWARI